MNISKDTIRHLQELKDQIVASRRVLIVTHDNPDPDCVASACAFQQIFQHMDREVDIASGGELGRSENRTMLASLDLDLHPLHEIDVADYDFLFFVDTQPGSGNNACPVPPGMRYGIIDHHILGEDWPHPPVFTDIRESYGATATLAYEYQLARNLKVDVPLATALYYAIRTETSDMGRGACKADHAAYLKLHSKIDWDLLHQIVHSRVSPEYFIMMKEAIERATRHGRTMVVDLGPIRHPDFVAEVADTFMRLEDIDHVLVWGWRDEHIVFSIRNNIHDPHMGRLARELVQSYGSAGGHRHMAGGQVPTEAMGLDEARLLFRRSLVPDFLKAVQQPVDNGIPLCRSAEHEQEAEC
jgi:nanoRNase/pAp phosphatase (c-di-AMP/oligoRNAs hydrolase)